LKGKPKEINILYFTTQQILETNHLNISIKMTSSHISDTAMNVISLYLKMLHDCNSSVVEDRKLRAAY
jgi:hypothetical protein